MTRFRHLVVRLARRMEAWASRAPSQTEFNYVKQLQIINANLMKSNAIHQKEMRRDMKELGERVTKLHQRVDRFEQQSKVSA